MQLFNQIITMLNRLAELLGYLVGKSKQAKADKEQEQHQKNIANIENDPANFGKNHFGKKDGE